MKARTALLLALALTPITCKSNDTSAEYSPTVVMIDTPPLQSIDSVLPIDESLKRFQSTIVQPVTDFSDGATSKEQLVTKLVQGIHNRDTASLTRLAVSRAEFAYLYYPNHPQSKPPYELSPQLMWFRLTANSEKGLRRALREFGGRELKPLYSCADSIQIQNGNMVWSRCVIKVPGKDSSDVSLFSAIVGREGVYKILSYANSL